MKRIILFIVFTYFICTSFIISANAFVLTAKDLETLNSYYYYNEAEKVKANGDILEVTIDDKKYEIDCSKGYIEYDKTVDSIEKYYILNRINTLIGVSNGYIDRLKYSFDYFSSSNYNIESFLDLSTEEPTTEEPTTEEINLFYEMYGYIDKNCNFESGEYICDYAKLSLETDRDDLYMEKTTTFRDDIPNQIKKILTLAPKISVEDVSTSGAEIFPQVYDSLLSEEENMCFVYRSTKKDSGYKRINKDRVKCNGEHAVKDTGLESGTTYYYRARLAYTITYSEPVEITTLATNKSDSTAEKTTTTKKSESSDETTTTKKAVPDNPKTGISSHVFTSLIIAAVGIVSIILIKKKSKIFSQI